MRYINLVPEVKKVDKSAAYRNRPDRKEFMKEYYAAYRQEHSGYVECDCGSILKEISMYTHIKSKKHINYLTN